MDTLNKPNKITKDDIEFVSIGPYCVSTMTLAKHNLRKKSYPLDYIYSSLDMILHCISDNFKVFLDKTLYENGPNNYIIHKSVNV